MTKNNVIDLAKYRKEVAKQKPAAKRSEPAGIPISPELQAAIETLIDRLRSNTKPADNVIESDDPSTKKSK